MLLSHRFLHHWKLIGLNAVYAVSAQDEIEVAVDYARKYLSLATESYRQIRYKLNTCPQVGGLTSFCYVS